MPFTNAGTQFAIYRIGSALNNMYIGAFAVGSGSGTALVSNVTLVREAARNMITGSPDFDTARKVTFNGDFSSTTMSGIPFTEFGLFTSGALSIGSTWLRESFGSIIFDGTNELTLSATIEGIPG